MWWGNVPARKTHSPRVGGRCWRNVCGGGELLGVPSVHAWARGRGEGRRHQVRAAGFGRNSSGPWWYLGGASALPVSHGGNPGGASGGLRSCRCLAGAILAVPRGDFGPAGASRGRTVALWPEPGPRCSWLAPSHKNAPTTFMSSVPSRGGFARACSAPHTVCHTP